MRELLSHLPVFLAAVRRGGFAAAANELGMSDRTLRWVLPKCSIDEPGLFLYFPRRAAEAAKLRTFINVAREVLRT